SRRRHTRWPRDWSSDVCSSDLEGSAYLLPTAVGELGVHELFATRDRLDALANALDEAVSADVSPDAFYARVIRATRLSERESEEIGRASCRERVEISEDAVTV